MYLPKRLARSAFDQFGKPTNIRPWIDSDRCQFRALADRPRCGRQPQPDGRVRQDCEGGSETRSSTGASTKSRQPADGAMVRHRRDIKAKILDMDDLGSVVVPRTSWKREDLEADRIGHSVILMNHRIGGRRCGGSRAALLAH